MNILSSEIEKQIENKIINVVSKTLESLLNDKEEDQRFLKPLEAAKFCGVNRKKIDEWVTTEELPKIKMGHRTVLYDKEDLIKVMIKNKV